MKKNDLIKLLTDDNFHDSIKKSELPIVIICEYELSLTTYIMSSLIEKLVEKHNQIINFYKVNIQENLKLQEEFSLNDFTILFFVDGNLMDYKAGIISEHELQIMTKRLLMNSSGM